MFKFREFCSLSLILASQQAHQQFTPTFHTLARTPSTHPLTRTHQVQYRETEVLPTHEEWRQRLQSLSSSSFSSDDDVISAMIRAFNTTLPAGSPGSWFESHSLMEVVARRPEVHETRLFLDSDTSFDRTILDALRSVTQDRNALGLSRRTNSDGFRYHIYLKNPMFLDTASLDKVKRVARKIADMTSAPREVYQWIESVSHSATSLGFGFDSTSSPRRVKFYVLDGDHVDSIPEFARGVKDEVLSALLWRVGEKTYKKRVYVPSSIESLSPSLFEFAQTTDAKMERVYELNEEKNVWTPIKTGFHLKDRTDLNRNALTQLLRDLDREDSSLFEWLRQTRGVAGPMHMFSVSVDDKSKEVTVYQMRSTVDQCVVSRRYSANDDDGEDVVEQEKKNSVLTSKILDKMTHGLVPEFLSQVYREKRLHVVPENTDAHSSQFLSSEDLILLLHAMYVLLSLE